MDINKQIRRLNAFGFAASLRIPDAVWVVLLVKRGFSLWQIGLAEGIFHAVSLMCEIPSGMAADLMGRRRSLAAAGVCGLVSALLMAFSDGFWGLCLSMTFSALACGFISGSDEALLYDSLLQAQKQEQYLRINGRYAQMQNLGSMLSNGASILVELFNYVGFYLLDGAVCLVRMVLALSLTEPAVTENQDLRRERPFQDLGRRFREHVAQVGQFLRGSPGLAFVMLADGVIGLPAYLTLMLLQQRLSEQGIATMWLGLPVMCISLSQMAGVALGQRVRPWSLPLLYGICGLLVGAGTVLAGGASVIAGVAGAMAAAASMAVWMLHLQKFLNERFPSDRRATLVSVNMMAYSLLMVVVSPVLGWVGDLAGSAGTGLWVLGVVVAAAGVGALCLVFRDKIRHHGLHFRDGMIK